MSEQTAIPVPETTPELGPCLWCGAPAVGTVEIEKPRYRTDRGVRLLARAALVQPACAVHIHILDWQPSPNEGE